MITKVEDVNGTTYQVSDGHLRWKGTVLRYRFEAARERATALRQAGHTVRLHHAGWGYFTLTIRSNERPRGGDIRLGASPHTGR